MNNVSFLKCIKCGREYPATPEATTCPACGPVEGILDVVYDYSQVKRELTREALAQNQVYSIWRYSPLLPILPQGPRSALRVGWTPTYRGQRLARELGVRELFIKDDGLNPTASLKDRASALGVTKALEAGATTVACASTGNAASSLAGNAASVGLNTVIFLPERAPAGKVAQLLMFGATVVSVQGNYQDAFRLSSQAISGWGWYNRNAAINPYLVEGKKTVSLEMAEQLGWKVPDWVVFSVGDGCTIGGAWRGFVDLYEIGLIDRLPRMLGVQAAGCAPIYRAWKGKGPLLPEEEKTLADSIAVGVPRNSQKALRAINDSQGLMITVSDEEILSAMRLLGRTLGIFGEPAGVAGVAGLKRALEEGLLEPEQSFGVVITGNGLKDVANGIKAAGEPLQIPPDIQVLREVLKKRGIV
ncbi:MAG: threonine synthase [Firmicutes bacterium]|nr:threonine synthase [Bacillota bacterium]MCL5039758.1 threonine synthase [Bacillota bacterium]